MDKQVKEAELLPLTVVDTKEKTRQGSAIYNCTFELQEGMPTWNAKAFSSTIAQELEKAIAEKRKVKVGYTENMFNGQPQYNIKSVDGKERSGFMKGKGFQKDTVSIERQASAKIAFDLLQFTDQEKLKDPVKTWTDYANKVYTWISARPSEPQASGGATEQKIDLNDLPPEFR
jgi:hypothetical protein